VVIPESSPSPRDTGVSKFSSDGPRLESWNKDREHGEHFCALAHYAGIEHSDSIGQCHQVWLDSSKSLCRRLERTHKSTWLETWWYS